MNDVVLLTLTALVGTAAGWAMTVPLHRFKEFRPKTPRDIAAEVGVDGAPPTVIRAEYRHARCPHCHHQYQWRDVMPVISWFRGCPECGRRLPGTVPLVQVGVPVAMLVTMSVLNQSWIALPYIWLVVVLAAIAIVDLRIWLIPYWMPWVGAAVGFALITMVSIGIGKPDAILFAAGGAVASFLLFFILWIAAPGKLGFGDVRLALLLGMFLAWMHPILPIYGLLFGALLGLAMGIGALVTRNEGRFAFGPALALGALLAIWFHTPILAGLG